MRRSTSWPRGRFAFSVFLSEIKFTYLVTASAAVIAAIACCAGRRSWRGIPAIAGAYGLRDRFLGGSRAEPREPAGLYPRTVSRSRSAMAMRWASTRPGGLPLRRGPCGILRGLRLDGWRGIPSAPTRFARARSLRSRCCSCGRRGSRGRTGMSWGSSPSFSRSCPPPEPALSRTAVAPVRGIGPPLSPRDRGRRPRHAPPRPPDHLGADLRQHGCGAEAGLTARRVGALARRGLGSRGAAGH